MRILGIDPGIRCTGFGIIALEKSTRSEPQLVDYGIITPPTDASMGERLAVLYDDIFKIITDYKPDEFAIEATFYSNNVKSALILGQARGVAILSATHQQLPVKEYAPRKVKLATTGNGRATKEQVQFMVQRILGMNHVPEPIDAADALAVAICHQQQLRLSDMNA